MTTLIDPTILGPFSDQCGQCGRLASFAVRDDGGSWTVWPRYIIPTGARISAWLCGICLKHVITDGVQAIDGMRIYSPSGKGKRSAMRRLMARLRGERR